MVFFPDIALPCFALASSVRLSELIRLTLNEHGHYDPWHPTVQYHMASLSGLGDSDNNAFANMCMWAIYFFQNLPFRRRLQ